jgi:HlyD family secretion protein
LGGRGVECLSTADPLANEVSMNALHDPPARTSPERDGEMVGRVQQLRLDGQLGGAKAARPRNAGWLPWLLAALLAFAWAGTGLRAYRPGPADANSAGVAPVAAATSSGTSTGSPAPPAAAGAVTLAVKGYIVPAVSVAVSPIDVAGQITKLTFKEGEFFEAGAELARIDATNYQYAADEAAEGLKAAQARLKAATQRREELDPKSVRKIEKDQLRATVNEAKAARDRADDEYARLQSIRGNVSGKEMDTARNDAIAAKFRLEKLQIDLDILEVGPRPERIAASDADVAAATAEVLVAEAKLSQAQWRVKNCVIRAPITGTITVKVAEKGVLVNPLATSAIANGGIGTIADLSDMEVDLEVAEREISQVTKGQPCAIKVDAYPTRPYTGVVDRVLPVANRAKSVVSVRVKVKLPEGEKQGQYLKPEMGAVVTFRAPG